MVARTISRRPPNATTFAELASEAQRLQTAEAERPRRRVLARVDRFDPGAVDLRDVGGVHEHERTLGSTDAAEREVERRLLAAVTAFLQ